MENGNEDGKIEIATICPICDYEISLKMTKVQEREHFSMSRLWNRSRTKASRRRKWAFHSPSQQKVQEGE